MDGRPWPGSSVPTEPRPGLSSQAGSPAVPSKAKPAAAEILATGPAKSPRQAPPLTPCPHGDCSRPGSLALKNQCRPFVGSVPPFSIKMGTFKTPACAAGKSDLARVVDGDTSECPQDCRAECPERQGARGSMGSRPCAGQEGQRRPPPMRRWLSGGRGAPYRGPWDALPALAGPPPPLRPDGPIRTWATAFPSGHLVPRGV